MRVAIEAASLSLTSGGLARYTGELAVALARAFPDDEFVLASDQPFTMPAVLPNLRRGGGPRHAGERRWWLWGLNRELARLHADVVHGPDFAVPYLPARPSVMTLHDLSPWMDPKWHSSAGRVRRRTPLLIELGIATMVVTVSETVRRQAMERFHIASERIVAVPLAASPRFHPVETRADSVPYFLYVGTLEPRKNVPELIAAWREVGRPRGIDLVIAGRRRADAPSIEPEPGLRLLGEVAEETLPALYSGALAFCFPTHYEGFGLPVLEAMQSGTCVVASRAVSEAGGDAVLYAEGASELAAALAGVAGNADLRARYQAAGLERAREFSWERTARATYSVYQEARRRFAR